MSDICQLDGNMSLSSDNQSVSSNSSQLSPDVSNSESNISSTNLSNNNSLEISWFSQVSECDKAQPQLVYPIPVVNSYRPPKVPFDHLMPPVRRVIRRENRCVRALSLPIILSCPTICARSGENMRIFWKTCMTVLGK